MEHEYILKTHVCVQRCKMHLSLWLLLAPSVVLLQVFSCHLQTVNILATRV